MTRFMCECGHDQMRHDNVSYDGLGKKRSRVNFANVALGRSPVQIAGSFCAWCGEELIRLGDAYVHESTKTLKCPEEREASR